MTDRDRLTPSLLEPQSRGGDIAEGGFSFQDHVILARLPEWLAQEGFTAMVKEATGDVEAKFFVPRQGFVKNLIEVKDHTLQPAEFWKEVKRFQEIDVGSPGTYRRFTLIGAGASKELQPILNGLQRVQGSQNFYDEQDTVKKNSVQEYVRLLEDKGGTQQNALFLLEKVTVETDWNTAKSHGEAVFKQTLVDHLDEYRDLSGRVLDDIYNHLSTFIRRSGNRPISRKELEIKLWEKIPAHQRPTPHPIQIYTAIAPDDNPTHPGLRFDWTRFSGGETRAIAPPEQWNQLIADLHETRIWIENHRNTKRIKLLGNRRLSACLAIGSVFSAVRGFAIDMEYRGELWSTDAHLTGDTPAYTLVHNLVEGQGNRLVVNINIYRNTLFQVQADLEKLKLLNLPLLNIQGEQPVISPQQINWIVSALKRLLIQSLQSKQCKEIHLFYTGPSHLALFLGHRLDATAPVICYGWTASQQYGRTCRLFST
ncbi:dsDNA nuclease domain-containing protein [Nodosilinea sp. PGN35]|uniref:CD-NTase-associated endodeoxyribonuclease Cap4 n=1 Tax=Nodosilinea sp. PGN35 TaxID=3020489 RepID=UPI0023B2CBE2|nr:dsDNA nuclease domain-containing protein [Nodosilinea sp. TSF1-S3]MDF0369629.1 SAVED domain-containing protein [Nodosilinea sp. TSF1-S3]